jgi:hypothetical protein
MSDQLLPLPLTERSVHLCVDMQRIFSADGLGRVKTLTKEVSRESRERRVSQAAIAAISGLIPMMFMTRVRL